MISGLENYMDEKGFRTLEDFRGMALGSVTDWRYLNLNHVEKAVIDQTSCIKCGRCHLVCEDTSHQAISTSLMGERHFAVREEDCVGCNLCASVCPVETVFRCATCNPAKWINAPETWFPTSTPTGQPTPITRWRPRCKPGQAQEKSMRNVLIKGGTVVNADCQRRADVLCVDGLIAAVGDASLWDLPAHTQVIDAGGCM